MTIYDGSKRDEFTWLIDYVWGITIWGIGANIFYSLGILLELFDWYYLNNKIGIKRFRYLFYIGGLFFSCIWTLYIGWVYFSKPYLW
ncbi:hypothetical protein [Flavobacterium chuncheonense]|uniref:hypothetical protein n=1 Tax=Flavobacterium chuncheonense TaxID=2026653 RepID=UPI0036D32B39